MKVERHFFQRKFLNHERINILQHHTQFMSCWAAVFFVMMAIFGALGYAFIGDASEMARSTSYIFAGLLIVSLLGRIRRPYLR
jgi:uncharacterized membrane protein YtjA (UPF0391 family)